MTHTSKVKFGARSAASEFTSGACSGPVKVSYFDPATGKPCASKPKPLERREQSGGEQKQHGGTRETGGRSAATVRPRRKARESRYRPRRNELGGRANAKPVYVDGKLYLSVREAAEAVGGNTANLATALRKGAAKYKGHDVRRAL